MSSSRGFVGGAVCSLVLSGLLLSAYPGVNEETRVNLQSELMRRHFTAKIDLYDAEIRESGEVRSEWDAEAIKAGMPIIVEYVTVKSSRIKLKLKHPAINERVSVEFVFDRAFSPSFDQDRDAFEKLLAIAFEEKKQP